MKQKYILLSLAVSFFCGALIAQNVFAAAPLCKDVTVKTGEETVCGIEIKNTQIFPFMEADLTLDIPDNIQKINTTNTWTCTSISTGIKCHKDYNPVFAIGNTEYFDVTLKSDVKNTYGIRSTVAVKGRASHAVQYTSMVSIPIAVPTAIAEDDAIHSLSDTVDLAGNDIPCSYGTTTFAYHDVYPGTVIDSFDINTGVVTLHNANSTFDVPALQYDILCNGIVASTARLIRYYH